MPFAIRFTKITTASLSIIIYDERQDHSVTANPRWTNGTPRNIAIDRVRHGLGVDLNKGGFRLTN